jgi:hypothetical protein
MNQIWRGELTRWSKGAGLAHLHYPLRFAPSLIGVVHGLVQVSA